MHVHTLYLLRHAKSAWTDPALADVDRPLSPRGQRDSAVINAEFPRIGDWPERILCSVARRTRETLAALVPHLRRDTEIELMRAIYDAGTEDLLALVQAQTKFDRLMLIGHNPAIEGLAHQLIGNGEPNALTRMYAKFPTSGLAAIHINVENWAAITPGSGYLAAFVVPRG